MSVAIVKFFLLFNDYFLVPTREQPWVDFKNN